MPEAKLRESLASATAWVTATPAVDEQLLNHAPSLKCVVEVSGAFPNTIDYAACAKKHVEVLSCSPGFRNAAAEMGLAMALACARGLFTEHEAFRTAQEHWLEDNSATDFTLTGANIGLIGFGQISQELNRLLQPFKPQVKAFDPWISDTVAQRHGVELCAFDDLLSHARCLFVNAVPTTENKGLLSAQALAKLRDNTVVVVLSRAHLVDFDALTAEAVSGRLRVATDVYPEEPLPLNHPLRTASNALLSPHRAAAVPAGRQLIGEMLVDDLIALSQGSDGRRLVKADVDRIHSLAGASDASQVENMAVSRTT